MNNWDVVVIGAGPAGAVSALLLASGGKRVLLVDKAKFPRDKICGSCLSAKTLGYLAEAGLGDLAKKLGAAPITKFALYTASGAASIALPAGQALSRRALDEAIIKRAEAAGVTFWPETTAVVGSCDERQRSLTLQRNGAHTNLKATCVIVADGVNGRSLNELEKLEANLPKLSKSKSLKPQIAANSRIGAGAVLDLSNEKLTGSSDVLDSHYQPNTIYMALHKYGYVGLVRMENNKLDLAGAFDPAFTRRQGSPQAAARAILTSANLPYLEGFENIEWSGTAPFSRQRKKLAARRLFILGDAASYGEPFTGEGIGWAIKGALLLAPIVQISLTKWDDSLVCLWQKIHQKQISDKQFVSLNLGKLLRTEAFSDFLIWLFKTAPFFTRPFVAATSKASNTSPIFASNIKRKV